MEAAQKILGTDDYRSRLKIVEDLSRNEKFDVLRGVREAKTKNPILWWKLKRRLALLEKDGLTPDQVESLVADLYRLANPESYVRKWFRGGYQEVKEAYIIESISQRLLNEDLSKVFADVGLLREAGAIEKIRSHFREQFRAFNIILSFWASGMSISHGVPFVYLPSLNVMDRIEIPASIIDKIFKNGLDSAYPDLERLYGRRGDFHALWGEFVKYGTYAAFGSLLIYSGHQAYGEYQKAKAHDLAAIEEKAAPEKLSAREQRLQKQIDEWKIRFRKDQGREPSEVETKDYSRVLKFYGGPGNRSEESQAAPEALKN